MSGEIDPLFPEIELRVELFLVYSIDLIQHQEQRGFKAAQAVECRIITVPAFLHVGDEQHQVRVLEGGRHGGVHGALHFVGGIGDDTRGVAEHDLVILPVDDAQNAVARRLRFIGDDAHALADESVHERTLAHVRATDDVDETGAVHG